MFNLISMNNSFIQVVYFPRVAVHHWMHVCWLSVMVVQGVNSTGRQKIHGDPHGVTKDMYTFVRIVQTMVTKENVAFIHILSQSTREYQYLISVPVFVLPCI